MEHSSKACIIPPLYKTLQNHKWPDDKALVCSPFYLSPCCLRIYLLNKLLFYSLHYKNFFDYNKNESRRTTCYCVIGY